MSKYLGWTALHWACDLGEKELVELLLNNCKADSSIKNNSGSSPIHLAVAKGHMKVVECLLSKKPSLVHSLNENNGWFPIHTAAYFRQTECLKVLIQFGASVLQITEKIPSSDTLYTPFHLATYTQIKRRMTVLKSPTEITRNLIRSISSPKEQEDLEDLEENTIHEFLNVLLNNLPDRALDVMYVGSHGSILHCLAASNHSTGVELICDKPYCHPPDTPNSDGISPLLMALELRALDSALVLLGMTPQCNIPFSNLFFFNNIY